MVTAGAERTSVLAFTGSNPPSPIIAYVVKTKGVGSAAQFATKQEGAAKAPRPRDSMVLPNCR